MPRSPRLFVETDIRNPHAEAWIIRADGHDPRDWLSGAPICAALTRHRIRHTGVVHMPAPFEIVRTRLGGSYFLATFGGEGRVLVDGRWARCRAGEAMLLPPGTLQAFHTPAGCQWDHCWVRYHDEGSTPLAAAFTPVFARFDPQPLRSAILGLYYEASGMSGAAALSHWSDLIHLYVLRFAQPSTMDTRLWELWSHVSSDLARPWSLADMAKVCHTSEKQLQRICLRDLGRTPRQHLIWLRMQRASELLVGGEGKVSTVAARVGYANPFVFSSTFKRIMGCSPSDYPSRRR